MNDPLSTLDRLAAKAQDLYTLPAVAMQVLELTRNPRVDTHALKECIENDPALTAKLLKVVNSSLFGLSRKVSDLHQALALLGTKPLKLLVLGFSLPPGLCDGVAGRILLGYWRHTLTKAVACRNLNEILGGRSGDEAFLAGLLQDLGILLLIRELGEPYVCFLDKVSAEGRNLAALEREAMGFDHTMLTARLLEGWNLPRVLVEAVACRIGGAGSPEAVICPPELLQTLHLAELFARFLADEHVHVLDELLVEDQTGTGLTRAQMNELLDGTQQQVEQLADALSLELPGGLGYEELVARAHRRLAAEAAEAAEALIRRDRVRAEPDGVGESLAAEFQSLSTAVNEAAARASRPAQTGSPASTASPRAGSATVGEKRTAKQPASTAVAEPDPGLLGRLRAAVSRCRASRCPLSLLLVELDDPDDLILTHGMEGYKDLLVRLERAAQSVDHVQSACLAHSEAGFAVILTDCDRQPAVRLAGELVDGFCRETAPRPGRGGSLAGVSVGVSTVSVPSRNFPPEKLLSAADRCLYASRTSGGVVKSIELY